MHHGLGGDLASCTGVTSYHHTESGSHRRDGRTRAKADWASLTSCVSFSLRQDM